jgi:hypothetical protein
MPPPRATLPWIALGLALVLATEPTWGFVLLGFDPALDELLKLDLCGRGSKSSPKL